MTSPDKPEDAPLRAEIQFFMDKVFQVSLAYFVLLISSFALSKTSITGDIAQAVGIGTGDLVACTLLLLDVLYAILSGACLFAVIKRGLFAMLECERVSTTWRRWEKFVRDDSHSRGHIRMNVVAWNIDNYYVMPVFLGVAVVSAASFWHCVHSTNPLTVFLGWSLGAMHLAPAWILYQLGRLNAVGRRVAKQP